MRRHLLHGLIALLIICPGNSFSGRLTAAESINAEKLLRESLVRSIPDSAICYWTWQISLNAELISGLTAINSSSDVFSTVRISQSTTTKPEPLINEQQYKAALSGSVNRYVTRQMQFNPFKVSDDSVGNVVSNVVTRADLGMVVKSFKAMPGWGSYDTRMDFNNNYKVDIADLSTVATNI